jgi:pilus assembly protein CpaE
MVSRHHATITFQDGKHFITDNESSNGTAINGKPIPPRQPIQLNHTDVIKFDVFEFIYVDSARADLWETLKPLSREGAQLITLYSPKGGAGLTSIAVNLAHTLANMSGKNVAIADFNLRFGDVLTYSVGKVGLSIHELIQEAEITGERITKYLQKGPGYSYLPAPNKTEYAELVKAEHARKVLWSLEANHDFVIVDLKNEIDDVSLTAWEISNLIYVVGKPEIGQILATKKILEIMHQLKYPETKVKVLINMIGREGTVPAEQIKNLLKRDFGTLPFAPEDAVLTSNGGQLYVKERPDCGLSQGIKRLAADICGQKAEIPEGGIFSKLKAILGF